MTQLSAASIWILDKYRNLEKKLEINLESYELAHAVDELYKFLWDYYANWYVEYLKSDQSQSQFARELYLQFIETLHPYDPFITEKIWDNWANSKLMLAEKIKNFSWTDKKIQDLNLNDKIYNSKIQEFENIILIVQNVRKLRGLFAIDPTLELDIFTDYKITKDYVLFFKKICKSNLKIDKNDDLYSINLGFCNLYLDVLKYVKDKNLEIKRTEKEIENLNKQINNLENQLKNQEFLIRAETEIIEQKQNDLQERKLELNTNKTKLKFLRK